MWGGKILTVAHMSYSLNSLKGGIGGSIGDYDTCYSGGYKEFRLSLTCPGLIDISMCVYLGILSFSMRLRIYLEGQGDLGSRLRRVITGVTLWLIGAISILTKSP